jgi:hypothetical protein
MSSMKRVVLCGLPIGFHIQLGGLYGQFRKRRLSDLMASEIVEVLRRRQKQCLEVYRVHAGFHSR